MERREWSRRGVLAGAGAAAGLATLAAGAAGKTERLTVTKVDLFRVVVPMKPDTTYDPEVAEDSRLDLVPKIILKVHTDAGIVGIGETGRGEDYAGVQRNAASRRPHSSQRKGELCATHSNTRYITTGSRLVSQGAYQ